MLIQYLLKKLSNGVVKHTNHRTNNTNDDDIHNNNKKDGQVLLFFGCRHRDQDFLYRDDWKEFVKSHTITDFHVAFSREQNRKVYVQHKLREYHTATKIANLILKENAYIYVCGDARTMASDVEKAFIEILALHSKMELNETEKYIKNIQKKSRYVQDIWNSIPTYTESNNNNI